MTAFIAALNSLNTPWVAVFVIVLGMGFDLLCKVYGVNNDAATGVIGAGIGLLTGQALNRQPGQQHLEVDTMPSNPTPPAAPAQPKEN